MTKYIKPLAITATLLPYLNFILVIHFFGLDVNAWNNTCWIVAFASVTIHFFIINPYNCDGLTLYGVNINSFTVLFCLLLNPTEYMTFRIFLLMFSMIFSGICLLCYFDRLDSSQRGAGYVAANGIGHHLVQELNKPVE